MESTNDAAVVELKIPAKPEYVGVARLAILGVASRMRFSYDEVEDVRLAVGEACTTSVEWASKNRREDTDIIVRSTIADTKLTVEIVDQAGQRQETAEQPGEQSTESLGALLITLLVDEVNITPADKGTKVQMIKYAG